MKKTRAKSLPFLDGILTDELMNTEMVAALKEITGSSDIEIRSSPCRIGDLALTETRIWRLKTYCPFRFGRRVGSFLLIV